MRERFKNMSLLHKLLTVILILLFASFIIAFFPKFFASILLIYSIYKIVIRIKSNRYLGCIPFVFLAFVGLSLIIADPNQSNSSVVNPKETITPEITVTPEVTATPEPTAMPEATATPEPTATPEVTATPKPTAKPEVTATPEVKLPQYHIESTTDSSIGKVIRKTLNIVVTDSYTLDDLYKIAEKEITAYTKLNKVNAIVAGFFSSADHLERGFDMGRVEYVPNGNFGDAVNVIAGDYSSFEFVNYLEMELSLPKGEEVQSGKSNIKQIKRDFEEICDNTKISVTLRKETLHVVITESNDEIFPADEIAISTYTDYGLEHFMSDIKYLDITVKRPQSSARALLDMSEIETDNGRYFSTFYIADNLQ